MTLRLRRDPMPERKQCPKIFTVRICPAHPGIRDSLHALSLRVTQRENFSPNVRVAE